MRLLSAAELLDIWDAGRTASPCRCSLLLLSAFLPEEREILANMPLGGLNARLLQLRTQLFGPTLNCLASCPACNAPIETAFGIEGLLNHATEPISEENFIHSFTHDDCTIDFRLPTAVDLLAIVDKSGIKAERELVERLIDKSVRNGESIPLHDLPEEALEALERQITEMDPLAHIELNLTCPDCGSDWLEVLHVIDFLWLEIGNLAKRILFEIARLASAFGWSEREILALTPERRRSYLELLEL
ncbi:T4 family baseplate hub assembly chaperone [Methylobacter marinus]|uniref:T4 family baseplate hub assembly chaperone n=1 Tax=Methylobacter marinus TaxID=34058 RepID=UPI0012EBE44B|nr:hypothetical protein [Methylobacter marinus]